MPGNKAGGLKAAAKNRELDPDFYKLIGRMGGKISKGGPFSLTGDPEIDALRRQHASEMGSRGGKLSGAARRAAREKKDESK